MSCDERLQQLSLMMDAESAGVEQAGLFAHLDGCPECRRFLDSLIRLRDAVRRDRAELLLEAGELLAAPALVPQVAGRAIRGGPARRPDAWPLPRTAVPAALAFAAVLLVAGIAIGAGLAARLGPGPRRQPGTEVAKQPASAPTFVYVCSMPEYEVAGRRVRARAN